MPQHILLFGDQTAEKLPSILKLIKRSKTSTILSTFLRDATDIVQSEVAKLNLEDRQAYVAFDNLITLAEETVKDDADEGVGTTLMYIVRLGELLLQVEENASILGNAKTEVYLLGLCTGLLPAAVAAVSENIGDVLKFGLEVLAIAVRLGAGIKARSRQVDRTPGSWAYTIVGATMNDAQPLLDEFNQRQRIPQHRHAFVGVSSLTWTTISGPPSVLSKLWTETPQLGLAPKLKLVANGAVHAGHLPLLAMEEVVGTSPVLKTTIKPHTRIVSSSTCEPFKVRNLGELLHAAILDITQNTLRLTETIQAVVSQVRREEAVTLITIGPTAAAQMVQNAFQNAKIKLETTPLHETAPLSSHSLRGSSDLVAIVGMSGRFPGGTDVDGFWETLSRGQDMAAKIPASRFDINAHLDPTGELKNSLKSPWGCFLDDPGLFDHRLFNISPREALQMDPQQRLLLLTTFEAMENAGYTPSGSNSTEAKRIATYMAQVTDDWRSVNECQGIDVYYIPGITRAFTPGRLNYHFKWKGASHSIDSACSGSATAVQLAASALLSRECDTAVAGGVSILAAPGVWSGLSYGGFLSPTGNCKTFRDDADGYCRGEAAGVVVLKRLEDAVIDNDNILAVISASSRTYSAHAASITQPHAGTQVDLYKRVLRDAGLKAAEIGYVEMHGTGTQTGDSTEMRSVVEVFGKDRSKTNPLVLGAVKANVGHGEAAAGVTSLVKAVMALRKDQIPPQPGMPFRLNPKFPSLDKMHLRIAAASTKFQPHPDGDGRRKILLNSFDAAGGNTCLILEDPPTRPSKEKDPRSHHIIVCSARTAHSLRNNKQRLLEYLNSHPEAKISDVAYTTTARRMHDVLRFTYVVRTTSELVLQIKSTSEEDLKATTDDTGSHSSLVFAFTGQGSLYSGMAAQLFATSTTFRESILSCQKICDSLGLPSVVDILADNKVKLEAKTCVQQQLALLTLEISLAELWRSWDIRPDLVIGHSLGEYAALCVSGVLSISDALYLVGNRASLMMKACTPSSHTMVVTTASVEKVNQALTKHSLEQFQVSCKNAPEVTVVSGPKEDLDVLQEALKASKIKARPLPVPFAFHSSQMDPILEDLRILAQGIHFSAPKIPVSSTLLGKIVDSAGVFTPDYLVRQTRQPVDFIAALQDCKAKGLVDKHTLWLEIGPDPVCLSTIRANLPSISSTLLPSLKHNEDDWKQMSMSIAAIYRARRSVAWTDFHREYLGCLSMLELPNYAFDLKNFWAPYVQEQLVPNSDRANVSKPAALPDGFPLNKTCLQYVESEQSESEGIRITFSSKTSEPNLFALIKGHAVDATAICPASVFCDMAYTAARYTYNKANDGKGVPEMSIWDLDITHPIVLKGKNPLQVIKVTAVMLSRLGNAVDVTFTATDDGGPVSEKGSCTVRLGVDQQWKNASLRTVHLVQKRIDDFASSAGKGICHRLQRPIVYKLFASLVQYHEDYQGIEEVFLDSWASEAAARVQLRPMDKMGTFTQSPYWVDAIIHLAGFLLNGDVNNPEDIAYISTGFQSMHIFEGLSEKKTYWSYVSIQPMDKKDVLSSDVYVLDGGRLVALCSGLVFHRMTRSVLNVIFGQGPSPMAAKSKVAVTSAPSASPKEFQEKQTSITSERKSEPALVKRVEDPSAGNNVQSGKVNILLNIIAAETGYDLSDLTPSTRFADMGVDSLMSIAITAAAQRDLGLELAATFFNDFPTVADMRTELEGAESSPLDADGPAGNTNQTNEDHPTLALEESTGSSDFETVDFPGSNESPQLDSTKPDSGETTPYTDISSSVPEQDEKGHIVAPLKTTTAGSPERTIKSSEFTKQTKTEVKSTDPPSSRVVLVRGRASSKETPLFLITDGAGSATAYIHLPTLSTGTPIYAIESPYLRHPHDYTCSVVDVCKIYIAAIRRTQPKGPYIVGGWSAGAVYAYEVSRQLLEDEGETILGLFLIDMRVPKAMPDALEPSLDLIESAGVFTGIERSDEAQGEDKNPMSQLLKEHLVSTIKALIYYDPQPMRADRRPKNCFLIWAQKGLGEAEGGDPFAVKQPDNPAVAKGEAGSVMKDGETGLKSWFYAKRDTFGMNGWDKLVGTKEEGVNVETAVMEGADHFSMVVPPKARELGGLLEKGLKKCIDKAPKQ